MSAFHIETSVTPPAREYGYYGSISAKTDLISITSVITKAYKIAVLIDFQELENRVVEEVSKVVEDNHRNIDKDVFDKIPYVQIELDENNLAIQEESAARMLEDRNGFHPIDGEPIDDEYGLGGFGNFKRYRVNLSSGSHLYLKTNIAYELASCIDAFNAKYKEFKETYWSDVCNFGKLKEGDIFIDSGSDSEYANNFFVKYDVLSAQYLNDDLAPISKRYKDFDKNYRVLNVGRRIDLNALSKDSDSDESVTPLYGIFSWFNRFFQ